jgi:hypothetical protein
VEDSPGTTVAGILTRVGVKAGEIPGGILQAARFTNKIQTGMTRKGILI